MTPHPSKPMALPPSFKQGRLEQSESLTGEAVNDSPVDCQSRTLTRTAVRESFDKKKKPQVYRKLAV